MKTCKCGRVHSQVEWSQLPLVGEQRLPWGEVQELRNCACGSTIAIVLDPGEADPVIAEDRYENVMRVKP